MTIYTTPEAFEDPTPTPGQRIGTGLGKGIGSGLEMLLTSKVAAMKQQKLDEAASQLGIPRGLSPELQKEYLKQSIGMQKAQQLEAKELREKVYKTEKLSGIFDELDDLNQFTGPLKYASSFDPHVRKQRQKYDSLAVALEKEGATMVGKGTMSKPRFEFLRKRLPSSMKTQATNEGAIEAWKKILEIPTEKKPTEKETFSLKKVPEGTPLTKEVVEEFKKRGLSEEDARKKARQLGYEF